LAKKVFCRRAGSVYLGQAVIDGTSVVAARTADKHQTYYSLNEVTIEVDPTTTTQLRLANVGPQISVYGKFIYHGFKNSNWSGADFEGGAGALANNTTYFTYIADDGEFWLSETPPQQRRDLLGFYHPSNPWRCVGYGTTGGSATFVSAVSLENNSSPIATVGFSRLTNLEDTSLIALVGSNNLTIRLNKPGVSLTIPSGATLGLNSGSNGYIYVYLADYEKAKPFLMVNTLWVPDSLSVSPTAITTGADTSGFFSYAAATGVTCKMVARLFYSTAPNGTYSAVPNEVVMGDAASLRLTIANAGALQSFASGTKTSGASNNYLAMTTNSLTLQPGR